MKSLDDIPDDARLQVRKDGEWRDFEVIGGTACVGELRDAGAFSLAWGAAIDMYGEVRFFDTVDASDADVDH